MFIYIVGVAFGYSSTAWSETEKGLYSIGYTSSSCSTPYAGMLLYPDVCIPYSKSKSSMLTSCTDTKASGVKYTASSACTVSKSHHVTHLLYMHLAGSTFTHTNMHTYM